MRTSSLKSLPPSMTRFTPLPQRIRHRLAENGPPGRFVKVAVSARKVLGYRSQEISGVTHPVSGTHTRGRGRVQALPPTLSRRGREVHDLVHGETHRNGDGGNPSAERDAMH